MERNILVLCDFDGTITTKNSFSYLIFKKFGIFFWSIKMISLIPTFILLKLKLINNSHAMATVVYKILHKYNKEYLEKKFSNSDKVLNSIIRNNILSALLYLKNNLNSEVYIVSASSGLWLQPWCDLYGFKLVSNQLKFDESGKLLKGFIGDYCWGIEKVNRISKILNLSDYFVISLGDTIGDREILNASDLSYYKVFNLDKSSIIKDLNYNNFIF